MEIFEVRHYVWAHHTCLMKRWILKVERQHRLRLPMELVAALPWLAAAHGTTVTTAHTGEHGELRILPPNSHGKKRFDALSKQLSAIEDHEAVSVDAITLARHAADAVALTFSKERNRVSVVLPYELRELKSAPKAKDLAVVFVFGSSLEIWRAEEWRQHLRSVRARLDELIEGAADELGTDKE